MIYYTWQYLTGEDWAIYISATGLVGLFFSIWSRKRFKPQGIHVVEKE